LLEKGERIMDKKKYIQEINKVVAEGKYHDTWDSLSQYRVPEWYRGAKFGIFIHWGVYAVPAFRNEWYPRNMYIQGSPEYEHHIKTYGKQKDFGYKDFIPMFKAENFNADQWAEIFKAAGANYIVQVAEHHDGFQMYRSEVSHYNAFEMGPRRDIAAELKKAVEDKGIIYGASSHRFEHWFFMGHGKEFESDIKEPLKCGDFYWPAMPEPDLQDLSASCPTEEYMEDWLVRTCEIVDRYCPAVVYFDWWIQHSALKPYLKKFAAYYYNRMTEQGREGIINYKHDAFMFGCAVVDIERGQFASPKPYIWQTDTAVARNSWCYTENNQYKTANEILCNLVDVVSKNGRMLLNIGPKADGTIPEEDRRILLEIGEWLKINGEAVYGSSVWRISTEGPTEVVEGQFSDGEFKGFTSEDIRFTVNGSYIYAFILKYPEDGVVRIKSLAEKDAAKLPHFHGIIKNVSVLGFDERPGWKRTEDALVVRTESVKSSKPVVIRILAD
jgi:alpha-L-fucosidase